MEEKNEKIRARDEQMTLGKVFESKDDMDTEIINSTITMIMGLQLHNFLFKKKEDWEDYFGKVMNLTRSLLKANEHCRKYLSSEKAFLSEYREECLKDLNTNIFLTTDSVGLNTELDGFLTQLKASLDTLAVTMNPVLGFNLDKWGKVLDKNSGKKLSGQKILNSLNNLPANLLNRAQDLITFIQDNTGWVSYLVQLRDNVNHHGGLKCVTQITFDYRNKEIVPQYIIHHTRKELVREFMEKTLHDFTTFTHMVLVGSILIISPSGMIIQKNPTGHFPPFSWMINERK